jgi:excisionase family DNA binding protein
MDMKKEKYLTIPQAAKILGISRIAVYKKVKNGQIKAQKIGRNYAIPRQAVGISRGKPLSASTRREIDSVIQRVVREYGETLRLLGRE